MTEKKKNSYWRHKNESEDWVLNIREISSSSRSANEQGRAETDLWW